MDNEFASQTHRNGSMDHFGRYSDADASFLARPSFARLNCVFLGHETHDTHGANLLLLVWGVQPMDGSSRQVLYQGEAAAPDDAMKMR